MKIPSRDQVDTRNPLSMAWWAEAAARYWGSLSLADCPDNWDRGYQQGKADAFKAVAQILVGGHQLTDLPAVRSRLREFGVQPFGLPTKE